MACRGADVPDVLVLMGQPGCVLCRVRDDVAGTWARWFRLENHHDPELLDRLERSVGFCPAHTRRLLAEAGPRLLRQPLESTVRGARRRAEQIKVQPRRAWLRRRPAPAPCPLCRVTRERERSAADDLATALGHPLVAAAIRDRGGLCVMHLLDLLPRLSSRVQVGPAAAAAAARLCTLVPGGAESRFMLAGRDPDAFARLPYLQIHVRQLEVRPDRSGMNLAERLIADLVGGSCSGCRAVGRAQAGYLRWLDGAAPSAAVALCPRHLHDSQVTAGAGTRMVSASHAAARDQLMALASGTSTRSASPPCGACQAGEDAERHQLSLLRARLPDARVRRALDDAHGVCLRHAAVVAADRVAAPVVSRLVTQLLLAQRDLADDVVRQARDGRHELNDCEQDAWRRIPALVDGEVYLGLATWSSSPAT
ncbi:MAG: hypothetical protein ACRDPD_28405 [Streptosporangiaceae bacterium]